MDRWNKVEEACNLLEYERFGGTIEHCTALRKDPFNLDKVGSTFLMFLLLV